MVGKFEKFNSINRSSQREDSSWMNGALCAQTDPEIFHNGSVNIAKKICAKCEVGRKCLQFALDTPEKEDAVYGGMTKNERKKVLIKSPLEVDRIYFAINALNRRLR